MRISDWSSDVCSSDLGKRCGAAIVRDGQDHLFRFIIVRQSHRHSPLAIRKGMFQRIGDKLRHQQAQRNGKIQINVQRTGINYKLNAYGCTALNDVARRSEEHTSELQSLMRTPYAVFS